MTVTRRRFLLTGSSTLVASAASSMRVRGATVASPAGRKASVEVDLPCGRVPLSFIIDDSTCLVNMGKFCMPQFAATYPHRKDYQQPWREWPDEIPDAFLREFGQWCTEQGVKGKFSVVPYPACVGWLDRLLPGWSQRELQASLELVRELMVPNWDIHPEMITHTRVIDLKTGRPHADYSPAHMENSFPQEDVSVDHLASYLAYALRILKNCGLPCEGITTPGGFGNRVKQKLPVAVHQAVRDVFGSEIPHYFKYVASGSESTEPSIEVIEPLHADSVTASAPLAAYTVNIPAGTGDWFGGWDGAQESQPDRYANQDATAGRMVELIESRRPALMLCHWPGMYCNGTKAGFQAFQRVVMAIHGRFADQIKWMKLSEIARYWSARFWTQVDPTDTGVHVSAPVACPAFTIRVAKPCQRVRLLDNGATRDLRQVTKQAALDAGSWYADGDETWICWNLSVGTTELAFE